jgi:hypothetical protein
MFATRDDGDFVSEVRTDPWQLIKVFASGEHVGHVAWQLTDQPRGPPIGTHTE